MARVKSVLVSMAITTVGRSHDCRFNKKHRLEKGMSRLTIKDDGDEHHYCLACARTFLLKGQNAFGHYFQKWNDSSDKQLTLMVPHPQHDLVEEGYGSTECSK